MKYPSSQGSSAPPASTGRSPAVWQVVLAVGVLAFLVWLRARTPDENGSLSQEAPPAVAESKAADPPTQSTAVTPDAKPNPATNRNKAPTFLLENVTIRDRDGRVVYRGEVDLTATIRRIEAGELLSQFDHDGIVFQNRERRLPQKPRGYYHEYVHPTPKQRGPGPQRVVTGQSGEIYYTHDHYSTFKRLK